jgi:peroxiredoxin Q/BCP
MAKKAKAMTKAKAKSSPKVSSKGTAGVYKLNEGQAAPAFARPATSGQELSLKSFKGRKLVLYFYPKDHTPGCTVEGQDFARLYAQFKKCGAEVVGVSRDTLKSHESFCEKLSLPFALISDEDSSLCRAFDVIQMKSLYGRKFEGIERSTFVIDAGGKVAKVWRKVKVPDHAAEVLEYVRGL